MLFKQWMLLEKKSGFFPQHDKEFMQLRLRDILGNYAEKKWGHCSHRSTGRIHINGGFTWAIPWSFKVGTGVAKVFATVNHVKTVDDTGIQCQCDNDSAYP